ALAAARPDTAHVQGSLISVLLQKFGLLIQEENKRRTLPKFSSCFVKHAKRTLRRPEPLSPRRYPRLPETIPAPGAQPPSRLLQCAPVVCSYQSQRVQLCTAASNICCPE